MQGGRGRIWFNMTRITIALYSFYCMQGVMLAFADRRYSATLPVWSRLITYSSICFGWFTVVERRKVKGRNVFLLILPVPSWLYLAAYMGRLPGGLERRAPRCFRICVVSG